MKYQLILSSLNQSLETYNFRQTNNNQSAQYFDIKCSK